jgi:hypothetical protein
MKNALLNDTTKGDKNGRPFLLLSPRHSDDNARFYCSIVCVPKESVSFGRKKGRKEGGDAR